jgi:RNA polymerase sigma-70 factor (ECF subfamily)
MKGPAETYLRSIDLSLSPLQSRDPEEAVMMLFDQMHTRLMRYSIAMGIETAEAEDILQETFVALFHYLRLGRSRENWNAWLFKVVRNLTLKRKAKIVREAGRCASEAKEQPGLGPSPEESILLSEQSALLQATVRAMPTIDQDCLRLRAEGLRYREIARVLDISLGGVAASLSRSFARLQSVASLSGGRALGKAKVECQ